MLSGEEVFKNPLESLEDESSNNTKAVTQALSTPVQSRCERSISAAVDVNTDGRTSPGTIANDNRFHRTEEINVDLDADDAISVDISDALSERDKKEVIPLFIV
ncbi:hypothetical protein DICVIV_00075 [Dictyocaulus viviparus]|uniref:Uncharacterized protein n=1 Tax=Dictyocaulus viviparus TaxID=29172 RepID=A0A0D8YBQ6_DICVI|nr:hypothetical protein DICVIV_00075 [Dictyocaulus viviparus]